MKKLEPDALELAGHVVRLWEEGKKVEATKLCDAKIQELLQIYAPATVAKDCQKLYRKAIANLSGKERYTEEPISFFKVPIETLMRVNEASKDSVEAQRSELIPITDSVKDRLLATARELLNAPTMKAQDIYNKAVAVMLLTGRRGYSEILSRAEFTAIDKYSVSFKGQAKGGEEKRAESYQFKVLHVTADEIVRAQNEISNYMKSRPWHSSELTDKDISGKCKKQVQACIDEYFNPIFDEIRGAGIVVERLHPHDLRKIAATIAHGFYGHRQAFTQFAASYLGHNTTNRVLGKKRVDTKTSESYEKFYLVEDL